MKAIVGTLVLSLLAFPLEAARVEIVLDVSGSMRATAGNVSRMEAAQRAVKATIDAIDANSNVALRLYGHRLPSEPKAESCRDTELVIPFGPLDRQRFSAAVQSVKPLGQTPLAYALEQAAADFGAVGDEPVAVILVSDGEESCGGDPARVACAFREKGLELTVHTVGFDVGDTARKQLQAISSCTGGEYRDAKNAGELADSLRQLTQAGLLIEKQREGRGNVVRGGNGFDSAVKLTPGTYRLDHHQRPTEFDYFAIDVSPGNLIRVSQTAFELGVTISGDTFKESAQAPFAGVSLHAPDKSKIGEAKEHRVGGLATVGGSVRAGQGGTFFVLVGGESYFKDRGIHKESPFTIEIIDASDAGSGTDAGDGARDAVRIEPGKHDSWMQPGDSKDTYWFEAVAGATYEIAALPDEVLPFLELAVADEARADLANVKGNYQAVVARVEQYRPTRSGRVNVTVSYFSQARLERTPVRYTLELTASGVPAPQAESPEPAADAEPASKGSFVDSIPGGRITCAVLAIAFVLLIVILIVVVVVMKKRSKGRTGSGE